MVIPTSTPSRFRSQQRIVLYAVVAITIATAGALSLVSSNLLERFAREKEVAPLAEAVRRLATRQTVTAEHFQNWQTAEAAQAFQRFADDLKMSLPPVAVVKFHNREAVLVWSDYPAAPVGEVDEAEDVAEVFQGEMEVEPAEVETLQQLKLSDALEVYLPVSPDGAKVIGEINVYYDASGLAAFIKRLLALIWGTVFLSVFAIAAVMYFGLRKQNAIVIRQARELAAIIEKSPIGIYTVNGEGVIESVNPKMVALLGTAGAKDLIGLDIRQLPIYQIGALGKYLSQGLAGELFSVEVNCDGPQGKGGCHNYHVVPLSTSGEPAETLLLFMVEDITERKEFERRIGQHAAELERAVAERTGELRRKADELEKFNKHMVDRELKMVELKKEIAELKGKLERV